MAYPIMNQALGGCSPLASQIKGIDKEALEVQWRLQDEVRKLIMRIEAGEPLLGSCNTCPKVYTKTDENKN